MMRRRRRYVSAKSFTRTVAAEAVIDCAMKPATVRDAFRRLVDDEQFWQLAQKVSKNYAAYQKALEELQPRRR